MALIAVVFIMVIMSAAVLMMSRLADMQSAERTLDLLGARAQSAAQSGLNWAIGDLASDNTCPTSPSTLTMDAESDLAGFTVVVTCASRSHNQGLDTVEMFDLTAQASSASLADTSEFVFRRVSAVYEFED